MSQRYIPRTGSSPKYAFTNAAAGQTDTAIAAAVTGRQIRVLSVCILCGATGTNVTFNSKPTGAGTAISIEFQNAANSGAVLNFNEAGWFQTALNEGLTVTTGAGSTTGIQVTYIYW